MKTLIEELGVTMYWRAGRWHWTIKSKGFDTLPEAFDDFIENFTKNQEGVKKVKQYKVIKED